MDDLIPGDEAELSEVIATAAASRTPLEIVGGGTRRALGRPVQAERTLRTSGLTGITLYEPGALTLVVRAGTPMAEVDAALEAEGQMLPFEPMDHRDLLGTQGEPTIGGAVAVAASGPRRLQKGACRDAMIGVRLVDGRGNIISNGGRVMKNVTGVDLVKLMAGSWGTLGVLSEISFKVLPAPRAVAVLSLEGLTDRTAVEAMAAATGSPFDVAGAAHLPAAGDRRAQTLIRLEGLDGSVGYRSRELAGILGAFGSVAVDTEPKSVAADWRAIRDGRTFAERDGAVWRVSVRPSDGPSLVEAVRKDNPEAIAYYDWAGGLVWLCLPAENDAGAASIRRQTSALGGHATLVRAPATVRAAVDVFEPEPSPLRRLSDGLRARFDPEGILNPGRMR